MRSLLLKLCNHLHFIACNMLFVHQVDVLDMTIIKNKIVNIIIVYFPRLIYKVVARLIQILFYKARPFGIGKSYLLSDCSCALTLASIASRVFRPEGFSYP